MKKHNVRYKTGIFIASFISLEFYFKFYNIDIWFLSLVRVFSSIWGLILKPPTTMNSDKIPYAKNAWVGFKYSVKYAEHNEPIIPPIENTAQLSPCKSCEPFS